MKEKMDREKEVTNAKTKTRTKQRIKEEQQLKDNKKTKENKKRFKAINISVNFTYIAIILIAILCICITPVTFQNDTYYTIKIGELIQNNGIDMMDHFSWHKDLPYTYPHWLYDLGTYLVYSLGGFKGVYFLTCTLSVMLGVSIYLVNEKLTKSKPISFIVTIGALYMLQNYIAARAQLATFILFIWEIFCIEKFLEKRKIIYGIILVLISLLIANLHVATWPFFFVLFLPYIGECLFSIAADIILYSKIRRFILKQRIKISKKKNKKDEVKKLELKLSDLDEKVSRTKIKRDKIKQDPHKLIIIKNNNVKYLIIVMIVCALMGLITPIGDTPYTYLYKTMQGNTTKSINEHLPLTVATDGDVMSMFVIFLAILIFTKTKIKLSDLFLLSGLCYLMLATRRQTSMFVLLCSVVLSRLLIDLIKRYTKNGIEEIEKVAKNIGVVIALSVLMIFISFDTIKPKLNDDFVNESSYPVAACDYILENIDLENARFYNEYNYGSYMLFRGIPVFVDSRADLYAPEFNGDKDRDIFGDFINTSSIGQFYEDVFEKYDVTHVITNKKSKMNMIITKTKDFNYRELYADEHFVVYERLSGK